MVMLAENKLGSADGLTMHAVLAEIILQAEYVPSFFQNEVPEFDILAGRQGGVKTHSITPDDLAAQADCGAE